MFIGVKFEWIVPLKKNAQHLIIITTNLNLNEDILQHILNFFIIYISPIMNIFELKLLWFKAQNKSNFLNKI